MRDSDTIRAVIRGTGINHNGRTPGISAPSGEAQERLIKAVYRSAGLSTNDTTFVEAHGTGTLVGDPIEANAIASAFQSRKRKTPLYIGAIKSGIGHLEGASGIAGIIKSILILENGIIPPNVNFERANPKIDTRKLKIAFPVENIPWPNSGVRRISVNSFGVGGTNAHCILDDAYHYSANRSLTMHHNTRESPPNETELQSLLQTVAKSDGKDMPNGIAIAKGVPNGDSSAAQPITTDLLLNGTDHLPDGVPPHPLLFVLSAFDEEGVHRNAASVSRYLSRSTYTSSQISPLESHLLDDLAFTLSERRSQFPWRSYVLANSPGELITKLENSFVKPVHVKSPPKIAFVFTGQGAQHYRMGRVLMQYPVFKKSLEDASSYFRTLSEDTWNLPGTVVLSLSFTHSRSR